MSSKTNNTNSQPVDLAAIYDSIASEIKDPSSKEYGKYLPFTWYRAEVVEVVKFLCEKHGSVPTSVVRQVLVAFLKKKIESLPEGNEKVFDTMGRIREEVTQKVLKERLMARLEASMKSSNAGPTITRSLGSPSNKDWLKKHHSIVYQDGQWSVVGSTQVPDAKQEEKSS